MLPINFLYNSIHVALMVPWNSILLTEFWSFLILYVSTTVRQEHVYIYILTALCPSPRDMPCNLTSGKNLSSCPEPKRANIMYRWLDLRREP